MVIATGGLGKIIYKNTDEIDIYDRDLTFKGLKHIYEKYTNEKKRLETKNRLRCAILNLFYVLFL